MPPTTVVSCHYYYGCKWGTYDEFTPPPLTKHYKIHTNVTDFDIKAPRQGPYSTQPPIKSVAI